MAQSFRDLQVWQRAMQLTEAVYRLTQEFPREELFGLSGQLRRSAVSIPSFAEGQGRLSAKEFRQFLGIARGSTCEVQTQLEIAQKLGFGSPALIDRAGALAEEARKMLFGLLESLRNPHKAKL